MTIFTGHSSFSLKCAAYMLFVLGICNLTFSCYMFTELKNPNVIVVPDPEIKVIKKHSMFRDTQLFLAILAIHHKVGIHTPGKQPMCPICEQMKKQPVRPKVFKQPPTIAINK